MVANAVDIFGDTCKQDLVNGSVVQVWRDVYTFTCLVAATHHLQLLRQGRLTDSAARETVGATVKRSRSENTGATASQQAIAAALHELDMAAIMGGPLFRRELDQLISAVQTLHEKHVDTSSRLLPAKRQRAVTEGDATNTASNSEPCTDPVDVLHDPDGSDSSLRPVCVTSFVQNEGQCLDSVSVMPQQLESASASHLLPPGSLQPHATQVPADHLPSLERCAGLACLLDASHDPVAWRKGTFPGVLRGPY